MLTVIIVGVLVYAAFHVGGGHVLHRYLRAAGLRPSFYWSSIRAEPCASVRLPGGFRVGQRL